MGYALERPVAATSLVAQTIIHRAPDSYRAGDKPSTPASRRADLFIRSLHLTIAPHFFHRRLPGVASAALLGMFQKSKAEATKRASVATYKAAVIADVTASMCNISSCIHVQGGARAGEARTPARALRHRPQSPSRPNYITLYSRRAASVRLRFSRR
ncbi:hypothetical protein EVAR_51742_1 [Eumeta japonica]|uniref:Uncharacterized protein n=1 Tax=Eumeta variegata TaxID=151549 RepID=A0A4C1XKI8_EUMVA|nr:hypothetical protein EVAR_51742_1 [Eumeta japonica]